MLICSKMAIINKAIAYGQNVIFCSHIQFSPTLKVEQNNSMGRFSALTSANQENDDSMVFFDKTLILFGMSKFGTFKYCNNNTLLMLILLKLFSINKTVFIT